MNSGCICCSLVGDFGEALQEVLDKFSPDRIIIEPSGVGKLSDVIKAVENVAEGKDVVLNSYTTVVDAKKTKMYMKNFGEFFNNQVQYAKTIILSRTDGMDEDKLEEVVHLLKEQNDEAILITTPWDKIDGNKILEAMEDSANLEAQLIHEHEHHHHHHDHDEECCCHHEGEHHHHHDHDEECCCHHEGEHHHHHDHDKECCCHHEGEHHHHHHADDVFTSWGEQTAHKYNKEELEETLNKLANSEEYGVILRAKGIVSSINDIWYHFDLVPGEYEVREGAPDYTGRLCVIGTNLQEDELKKLFSV